MAINYSEKIPNNVNLADDRTLQRALEQWQPNFINWWDDVGPDGSTNYDVYLRTADQRRPAGLGAVRLREDARLPLGHLPQPGRRRTAQIHFGDHKGEKAWQDVPGEHRANLRRIIVTQGDTEPASVEQQRHLGLTAPSHVRPAQPVPDQRRGRPPPVGDGLPAAQALRPRRPRGGRGAARAHLGRREQPAHPRRLQREDARLAGLLHVHLLHRPRRQVPALGAGRERLRSAGAHHQVHADRGSAPHVRGRERRLARARSAPRR